VDARHVELVRAECEGQVHLAFAGHLDVHVPVGVAVGVLPRHRNRLAV
jgi:hypothetical protein